MEANFLSSSDKLISDTSSGLKHTGLLKKTVSNEANNEHTFTAPTQRPKGTSLLGLDKLAQLKRDQNQQKQIMSNMHDDHDESSESKSTIDSKTVTEPRSYRKRDNDSVNDDKSSRESTQMKTNISTDKRSRSDNYDDRDIYRNRNVNGNSHNNGDRGSYNDKKNYKDSKTDSYESRNISRDKYSKASDADRDNNKRDNYNDRRSDSRSNVRSTNNTPRIGLNSSDWEAPERLMSVKSTSFSIKDGSATPRTDSESLSSSSLKSVKQNSGKLFIQVIYILIRSLMYI